MKSDALYKNFPWKLFFLTTLLLLMVIFVRVTGVVEQLDLAQVQGWVLSFGALAPLVFIGVYLVATIFFLPGTPLAIAAGALFGPILGGLYILVGAAIGSTFGFFLSRYAGRPSVERYLQSRLRQLDVYDERLESRGFSTVFLLRLVPLLPFTVLSYVFGLTSVRFKHFLAGSVLGIAPGTFIYAYFGDAVLTSSVWKIFISVVLLVIFWGMIFSVKKGSARRR